MSASHPITALRKSVENASERVFREAIASRPGEAFYAFVLTTYDQSSFGGASANTIENHEAIWRAAQQRETRDVEAYYRWYCGEWGPCEFIGDQSPFESVARLYEEASEVTSDKWNAVGEDPVRQALADALAALDAKGLFGTGEKRAQRMVFLDEYDSFSGEQTVLWSAKRLNPPLTFDRFEREYRQLTV